MKIKDGFILKEIAGESVVVPVGDNIADFSATIILSESGAFLWRALEKGANEEQLLKSILSEYNIDAQTAKEDIKAFIDKLTIHNLLEK
ncbi:MAG: PqqD family protein [Eubacteriales bacterium]|nr:PqqD family protein [Eubacteriales bacterium]